MRSPVFVLLGAVLAWPSTAWSQECPEPTESTGVVTTQGVYTVNPVVTSKPYMWISNAGEDTVSKIATDTNREVARYTTAFWPGGIGGNATGLPNKDPWSGPAPSRSGVDTDGNAFIANRGFGRVAEVVKILTVGCVDRNNNQVCDTSIDTNDNGAISTAEMYPIVDSNANGIIDDAEIKDERVAWIRQVGGSNEVARALTVDNQGYVWVGMYNTARVYKIDPTTGATLFGPMAIGVSPYGAAVDSQGRLFTASLGATDQVRFDTEAANPATTLTTFSVPYGYGIAVGRDQNQTEWVAIASYGGNRGAVLYNPTTLTSSYLTAAVYAPFGVSFDTEGYLIVGAANGAPGVSKWRTDGSVVWSRGLAANCPSSDQRGAIVDSNNDIWLVNRSNHMICKYLKDGTHSAVVPTGLSPYTYSDASGIGTLISDPTGKITFRNSSPSAGYSWGGVDLCFDGSGNITVTAVAADTEVGLDFANPVAMPLTAVGDQLCGTIPQGVVGRFIEFEFTIKTGGQVAAEPDPEGDCGIVIPNPPIATCKNVTVTANNGCFGSAVDVNNGSTDPDGVDTVVSITQNPPVGSPLFHGANPVVVTITDDSGLASTCTGIVTVTVPNLQPDTCDGIDNDCDGFLDAADSSFVTSPCGLQSGVCSGAVRPASLCVNGRWSADCPDSVYAARNPSYSSTVPDLCNGVDNDCDGADGNDYVSQSTTCGVGACASTGTNVCQAGALVDSCRPGLPSAEVCDGIDNDCDGLVDAADPQLVLVPCDKQSGVCAGVMRTAAQCSGGAWQACPNALYASLRFPDYVLSDACDAKDNDCDGAVDEDFQMSQTTCGTGACARAGVRTCSAAGTIVDSCVAPAAGASDISCNGIDDNCNGATDEGYVASATACGQGACARVGLSLCVRGALVDSCSAGSAGTSDTTCDGVDDDCNGQPDDGYVRLATSCGAGFCASTGETSCTNGVVNNSCVAGQPSAGGEVCDGIDNDCDGLVDSADPSMQVVACEKQSGVCAGLNKAPSMCVGGQWQACTDGFYTAQRLETYRTNDTCDGLDNDCNGVPDDDHVPSATTCGKGICTRGGSTSCSNGVIVDSCVAGPAAPGGEVCDGLDNDCDGLTDGADSSIALVKCEKQAGVCSGLDKAPNLCVGGQWQDCPNAFYSAALFPNFATSDTCDGLDNDCDSVTDENHVPTTTSCGLGTCARTGQSVCQAGNIVNTCAAGQPSAGGELCDGVDNDCDGLVDAADPSMPVVPCEKQAGVCAGLDKAPSLCVAGRWQACNDTYYTTQRFPNYSTTDTCDGRDNDCDNVVDENHVAVTTTCGVGACGRTGQTSCSGGNVVDSCTAGQPSAGGETCDGADNDCDGLTDSADPTLVLVDCEKQSGVCAGVKKGPSLCLGGQWQACSDAFYTTALFPNYAVSDTCDGRDNDCDGTADENHVAATTTCGVGTCARNGQTTCSAGTLVDSCVAGAPSAGGEICDGLDNDCDGLVDAADSTLVTPLCEKQNGVCAGVRKAPAQCQSGAWTACSNATYVSARFGLYSLDDGCDGLDNDCDLGVDEDFSVTQTTCGTGACSSTGQKLCSNGDLLDTCAPGNPTADTNCDGVDDDCNGQTDEGWVPPATECGVGACVRTGLSFCVQGAQVDSCTPAAPAASDQSCNGIDENCDGQADEGFPANQLCIVGRGTCERSGLSVCDDGGVVCSVSPGTPGEELCDGLDNDCNGEADDGLAGWNVCERIDTALTSRPPSVTASTTASFTFNDPLHLSATAFECSLDGGPWVRCDGGAISYTGLASGRHTFLARSIGPSGAVDPTPAFFGWGIDLATPETFITLAPQSPSQSVDASFAFSATVADVGGYWCALDPQTTPPAASDFVPCDAVVTYQDLAEGPHELFVYVVSAAGNVDTTPAHHAWIIDLSAPETLITSAPAEVVTAGTAAFTFDSPDDGVTGFRCRFNGGEWSACVGTTQSYSGLVDGTYTFEVAAVGATGIVDPTPAIHRWTVDTRPPDTFITLHPTNPAQSPDATFAFSSNELGVTFQCAWVADMPALGSVVEGGWQSCDQVMNLTGLESGTHDVWVAAVDAMGLWDPTPASFSWVVDMTAPDTLITARPPVQTGPNDGADFAFTAPDTSDEVTFECRIDESNWQVCNAGTYNLVAGGLAVGDHTFQVRACTVSTGLCDPTPSVAAWTVTTSNCPLDAIAPTVVCPTGGEFECTGDGQATVTLGLPTGQDACGVLDASQPAPTTFVVGTTPVTFAMDDGNRNRATCITTVKVVDTTPPVIRCGDAVEVSNDEGLCGAAVVLDEPVATDACNGSAIVFNNAPAVYPVGTTTVTWTALDVGGLASTCTVDVTVRDEEGSTLSCSTELVVDAPADACGWTGRVEATSRDNCAVDMTTLTQDRSFPVGFNDVEFTSTDPGANVSTCVTRLEVRDVTPPVVACPAASDDMLGAFMGTASDACEAEARIEGIVCEALDVTGAVIDEVRSADCPVALDEAGALVITGRLADPVLRVRFEVAAADPSGNEGRVACELTFSADRDGDGTINAEDNCPDTANDGADTDGDGVGDACDVCPLVADDQADGDDNGVGDVCQDSDSDGTLDATDNCPAITNADQSDWDADGVGDLCDPEPYENFVSAGSGGCSNGAETGYGVLLAGLALLMYGGRRRAARR